MHQSCLRSRNGNMANKMINVPWSNVDCEKDIANTLIWSRWLLRVLGIWPLIYPETTRIEKMIAVLSFAMCWIVLGLFLVLVSIHTFSERSTMSEMSVLGMKMDMLGQVGYLFLSILKYFFLVARYKNIRRCVQILSADWRAVQEDHHREIMMRDAERGHLLSKFCIVFIYCGGLSYNTVMPFVSQTPVQNVTFRPMAYFGFDSLFDLQLMPVYVFAFCLQSVIAIVMFNITTAICCLAAMLVAHACGQTDVVMARIESLVSKGEKHNQVQFDQYMAIIVQHHVRAIRFSTIIENTLHEVCLVELVGTTLIMCLIEYYLIMEWNNSDSIAIFTYFVLFLSVAFNIFMFCHISELLTQQYSKLGYTSYKIEWYNLPGKVALDLMLVITMSRHSVKITAGKLINLSFTNFANVLKTSVAYLNLIRTAL